MIVNWDQLPLVLQIEHMAQLLDVCTDTICRRCRAQRMFPAPATWEKPWIWYRENVRAQLETGKHLPIGRPARRKPFERARQRREELAAAS